ncbi:MAG: hypothetical protein HGA96_08565 [Desulfobulbaceae bacterium]|nr:hypothetical protein [Desulfobulbaceae bacterium]
MKIKNAEEARSLIKELLADPVAAQTRNLRLVVENLELDQMYYEQKGNDQGIKRCEICLDILRHRLDELG